MQPASSTLARCYAARQPYLMNASAMPRAEIGQDKASLGDPFFPRAKPPPDARRTGGGPGGILRRALDLYCRNMARPRFMGGSSLGERLVDYISPWLFVGKDTCRLQDRPNVAPIRADYRGCQIFLGPPPPAASGFHIAQCLISLESL